MLFSCLVGFSWWATDLAKRTGMQVFVSLDLPEDFPDLLAQIEKFFLEKMTTHLAASEAD